MKPKGTNRDMTSANRLYYRLAAEKKKAGIAVCLIAIMGVMWGRVLLKKGPQDVQAQSASSAGQNSAQPQDVTADITFVELPETVGRNDRIVRDFFACEKWREFQTGLEGQSIGGIEVNDVSAEDSEKIMVKLAAKLRFMAVQLGDKPQVFINDKLLSVGDKLYVRQDAKTYECEVVHIGEDRVSLRCSKGTMTLKLSGRIEVNK